MKIAVCIKQVPGVAGAEIDLNTGLLKRDNLKSIINPSDLYALETGLRLKEKLGNSEVHVFTMGPKGAKDIITYSFSLGVDKGYLISDINFSGADIVATSNTLYEGIKSQGEYNIIIFGSYTIDGGTGFVPGAVAEKFNYSFIGNICKLDEVSEEGMIISSKLDENIVRFRGKYPLVISVEPEIFIPRLPTLKNKISAKKKEVKILNIQEFQNKDENYYGLKGSATKVLRSYEVSLSERKQVISLSSEEGAEKILEYIIEGD